MTPPTGGTYTAVLSLKKAQNTGTTIKNAGAGEGLARAPHILKRIAAFNAKNTIRPPEPIEVIYGKRSLLQQNTHSLKNNNRHPSTRTHGPPRAKNVSETNKKKGGPLRDKPDPKERRSAAEPRRPPQNLHAVPVALAVVTPHPERILRREELGHREADPEHLLRRAPGRKLSARLPEPRSSVPSKPFPARTAAAAAASAAAIEYPEPPPLPPPLPPDVPASLPPAPTPSGRDGDGFAGGVGAVGATPAVGKSSSMWDMGSSTPTMRARVMWSLTEVGLSGSAASPRMALMFMKPWRTQPAMRPRSWIQGHHHIGSPWVSRSSRKHENQGE